MDIHQLYHELREIGKRIKGTKRYYLWEFVLGSQFNKVELFNSLLSGKKKLCVNSQVLTEEKKLNGHFNYSFRINTYYLEITQLSIEKFELKINNTPFEVLLFEERNNKGIQDGYYDHQNNDRQKEEEREIHIKKPKTIAKKPKNRFNFFNKKNVYSFELNDDHEFDFDPKNDFYSENNDGIEFYEPNKGCLKRNMSFEVKDSDRRMHHQYENEQRFKSKFGLEKKQTENYYSNNNNNKDDFNDNDSNHHQQNINHPNKNVTSYVRSQTNPNNTINTNQKNDIDNFFSAHSTSNTINENQQNNFISDFNLFRDNISNNNANTNTHIFSNNLSFKNSFSNQNNGNNQNYMLNQSNIQNRNNMQSEYAKQQQHQQQQQGIFITNPNQNNLRYDDMPTKDTFSFAKKHKESFETITSISTNNSNPQPHHQADQNKLNPQFGFNGLVDMNKRLGNQPYQNIEYSFQFKKPSGFV